jgi:hypothetical protein
MSVRSRLPRKSRPRQLVSRSVLAARRTQGQRERRGGQAEIRPARLVQPAGTARRAMVIKPDVRASPVEIGALP